MSKLVNTAKLASDFAKTFTVVSHSESTAVQDAAINFSHGVTVQIDSRGRMSVTRVMADGKISFGFEMTRSVTVIGEAVRRQINRAVLEAKNV